jgi:SAM-dependent methyltransferase
MPVRAFRCRLCQSEKHRQALEVREMMFGSREQFWYDQCANCEAVQIREIPADLGKYYPSDYYSQSAGLLLRALQRIAGDRKWTRMRQLIDGRVGPSVLPASVRAVNLSAGSRILDVGCGSGELLRALRVSGFLRLQGVDPFLPVEAIKEFGLNIRRCTLGDLRSTFDVVMMHHVFEHSADPERMLREAGDRLSEGGALLLRFPCVPCEAFDRFGANWVQLDAPRHLHIYSRRSIECLADRVGLALQFWENDSTAFQFWASAQYEKDIPLRDPRSYANDPELLPIAHLRELEARASAVSAAGRGDQAIAVLRRK